MTAIMRTYPLKDLELSLESFDHEGTLLASYTNPRVFTGLKDAEIHELADDIAARGIQVALNIRRVKIDKTVHILVIDGQRRIMALRYLQEKKRLESTDIPTQTDTEDVPEFTSEVAAKILEDSLAIGVKREALSSYELCRTARELRASGKEYTNDRIGRTIGRSSTWVSRMLTAFGQASEDLLKQWRQGKITDEAFKELATVPVAEQKQAAEKVVALREGGTREARADARMESKVTAAAAADAKPTKAAKPSASPPLPAQSKLTLVPDLAPPPAKPPKPGTGRILEFAALRKERPSTDPYVRGLVDMAAFVVGELAEVDLAKPYHKWVAAIAKHANATPAARAVAAAAPAPAPKARIAAKKVSKPAAKKPAKSPARAKGKGGKARRRS